MESDSSCYDEEDDDEDEEDSLSIKAERSPLPLRRGGDAAVASLKDVLHLLLGGLVNVLLEVAPFVVRGCSLLALEPTFPCKK